MQIIWCTSITDLTLFVRNISLEWGKYQPSVREISALSEGNISLEWGKCQHWVRKISALSEGNISREWEKYQSWVREISNLWINQETLNIALPPIKQRTFDRYKQSLYQNINNSQRLITYCRFKHSFEIEQYLDFITDRWFKNSFN